MPVRTEGGRYALEGDVCLHGSFKAEGGVNLASAKIRGHLDCEGGGFIGKDTRSALDANGVKVKSGVFLRTGFVAKGGVDLRQAQIDGSLDCRGGNFIRDKQAPLNANGAKVMGAVSLSKGFKAEGGVNLLRAKIGMNLECNNGQFIGKGPALGEFSAAENDVPALIADGAKIDGAVHFCAAFVAIGEVDFENAKIDGAFEWTEAKSPEEATLKLRGAKAGMLLNSQNSWPKRGHLKIDGFVYDQIHDEAPKSKVQLGWLDRQPSDSFISQPYEHLATVLTGWVLKKTRKRC